MTNFQDPLAAAEQRQAATVLHLRLWFLHGTWNILSVSPDSYIIPLISRNVYGQCTVDLWYTVSFC